jgi:hypothetical protein
MTGQFNPFDFMTLIVLGEELEYKDCTLQLSAALVFFKGFLSYLHEKGKRNGLLAFEGCRVSTSRYKVLGWARLLSVIDKVQRSCRSYLNER